MAGVQKSGIPVPQAVNRTNQRKVVHSTPPSQGQSSVCSPTPTKEKDVQDPSHSLPESRLTFVPKPLDEQLLELFPEIAQEEEARVKALAQEEITGNTAADKLLNVPSTIEYYENLNTKKLEAWIQLHNPSPTSHVAYRVIKYILILPHVV